MSHFLDIFKTILSNLIFLMLYVPSGFIKKIKKDGGLDLWQDKNLEEIQNIYIIT